MDSTRLETVLRLIDEANSRDPKRAETDAGSQAGEELYGRRMSARLESFLPAAGEALRIAVRGQHIERWTSPRKSYPEGRVGYLRWRKDLKDFHARRVGELMTGAGYDETAVARVAALIRKERLKHDAEAQALEDVVCLVFLEHYAADFIASHEDPKVVDILAKTARKMSPDGLAAATKLDLEARLSRLLGKALAGAEKS